MSVFDGNTPRRNVEPWPEDRVPTNDLERLIASANPYIKKERDEAERARAEAASRCRAEGGNTSNNKSSDLAAKAPAAQAVDAPEIEKITEKIRLAHANPVSRSKTHLIRDVNHLLGHIALLRSASALSAGAATTSNDARALVLLKAAHDLLKKQRDAGYVLNLLAETVFYDDADCDGGCLMEDIGYVLDDPMSAHQAKKGQDQ